MKRSFEEDLARAVEYHGHLCSGQIIGTRIARIALDYFGIDEPETYRNLVAFVEADRCVADAVNSVANCHIGKRRMKFYDYGKMAASFYDITSGKAVRVALCSQARPADEDDKVAFFNRLSDSDLFKMWQVELAIDKYDLPGHPLKTTVCEACGEKVMDNRDIEHEGKTLCKVCAGEASYYKALQQIPLDHA